MPERIEYETFGLGVFSALIAIGYALTSHIYLYGLVNHNEQLPAIIHLMDSAAYANDVLVVQNASPGSPRYLYFRFVAAVGKLVGLELGVAVLYAIALSSTLVAVYVFTVELFDDRCIGLIVIATFLLPISDDISLGGSAMVSPYLIPSMLATPLVLIGFIHLLRRRLYLGFGSLGVATAIHLSIGVWMSGVAILALSAIHLSAQDGPVRSRLESAVESFPLGPLVMYLAISLVSTFPILRETITTGSVGVDFVWLIAWFRHPHHYVPSTWLMLEILTYTAVVVLAAAALAFLRYTAVEAFSSRRSAIFGLTVGSVPLLIMFIGGFVFTELVRVDPVIKLQPFRIDYFPVLVFVGLISKGAITGLRALVPMLPPETVGRLVIAVAVVLSTIHVAAAPGVVVTTSPPGIDGVDNIAHYEDDITPAYDWIGENTPRDAVIMTPPHETSARLETGRAIVVDSKTFVFRPQAAAEWKHRLDTLCGKELETSDWKSECKDGYPSLSRSEILAAAEEFGSCWIVTPNDEYDLPVRHSSGGKTVYDVSDVVDC